MVVTITNKKVQKKTKFQIEIRPQPDSLRLPILNALDNDSHLTLLSNSHNIHLFSKDSKVIEKLEIGEFNNIFVNSESNTVYLRSNQDGSICILKDREVSKAIMKVANGSLTIHDNHLIVVSQGDALKSYPLQ